MFELITTRVDDCGYFPGKLASTVYVNAGPHVTNTLYGSLIDKGFRRSGETIYRPFCPGCQACISVRVAPKQFQKNRAQKRCWKQNLDISVSPTPIMFNHDHYALYLKYVQSRHPEGEMADFSPKAYMQFLGSSWSDTVLFEFRLNAKLVAVAVVDMLSQGLSAVYTFFDPDYPPRSLGIFAVLFELQWAFDHDLQWVYLGYWIRDCQKMNYKNQFQPMQKFVENSWY